MLDIKFVRENVDIVKENIKKKFQEEKLSLVDEVLKLDEEWRKEKYAADGLRAKRNKVSEEINQMMKAGKKQEARGLIQEAKEIPAAIKQSEEVEQKLRESLCNDNSDRSKECISLLESPEKDIGIRPNAGCYFLTFEAKGANISALSAIAYSVIEDLSEKNYKNGKSMIYYYDDSKFTYELFSVGDHK